MLLLNYDFYDVHSVLTMLRAKPKKSYNCEIIKAVFDVLVTPQTDNMIENNIIRKRIRTIEAIDNEDFGWVYVDNIYTYGWKIIKDEVCYPVLANGFRMMLEYAELEDFTRLSDLADALHNVPIFFADGCKRFKKETKVQFAHYNKTYKTNLLKELMK